MKTLITSLLFFSLSIALFAQNPKALQRAENFVERVNTVITTDNKGLALSASQKTKIKDLFIQRGKAVSEWKKANPNGDKEEQRSILQKYNKKIFTETLSKEQFKAWRTKRKQNE